MGVQALCVNQSAYFSLQLVDQFLLENVNVHGGAGTEKQSQLYIGERQRCPIGGRGNMLQVNSPRISVVLVYTP